MMNDVAALRGVFPRHTAKRLALATGAPVNTAREWIYRHLSASRRRELALAALAEMDRQDALRAQWRMHFQTMVGIDEMAGAGTRPTAEPTADRKGASSAPSELGGKVNRA